MAVFKRAKPDASLTRCITCRFWESFDSEENVEGWCHRYPPMMEWPSDERLHDEESSMFSITGAYDWCGEFRWRRRGWLRRSRPRLVFPIPEGPLTT